MNFALLAERLKQASQQYYADGSSSMTDEEFDKGLVELSKDNPTSDVVTSVGHGYNPAAVSGKVKRPHRYGLVGSLPKCHNLAELPPAFRYLDNYNVSIKLDGISCVLYYADGKLVYALTRGDGTVGIDITETVIQSKSVPRVLSKPYTLAVRGEILMRRSTFQKYRDAHPEAKNARNTVAGIVGRKNNNPDDNVWLEFVAYRIVGQADMLAADRFVSHTQMLEWLKREQFNVVPYTVYNVSLGVHLMKLVEDERRSYLDSGELYPWDGLVITANPITINSSCGYDFQSTAFKFSAEEKAATVTDVEWNLSRQNYLIPKIRVEPIELSGTTVTACAGFNARYIQTHCIGPGALVRMCKSGEIIPDVQEVLRPGKLALPNVCPACSCEVRFEGVHLVCPNPQCCNVTYQDVKCWLEFIAPSLNFDTARKMAYLEQRLGKNFTVADLMDAKSDVLISNVNHSALDQMYLDFLDMLWSRTVPASEALQSLNIPRLGDVCSKKLAKYQDVVDQLIAGNVPTNLSELIGQANAASIANNVHKFNRLRYIRDRIVFPATGQHTVAVTGKLSISRKLFEEELARIGYEVASLTRKCEYLITDDPNSGSSKNKQADKYNIPKITEAEFRKLVDL